MSAALPTDESWNAFNNTYNHTAYQTIRNEFGVDPQKSDWKTARGHSGWPTALAALALSLTASGLSLRAI